MSEHELRELLLALSSSGKGDCWCGVAIGNPMYRGRHSELCVRIRTALTPMATE